LRGITYLLEPTKRLSLRGRYVQIFENLTASKYEEDSAGVINAEQEHIVARNRPKLV